MLHISIKAEELVSIFGFSITNSLLLTYITLLVFLMIGLIFKHKSNDNKSTFVFFMMFLINGLHSLFKPILKDKIKVFFPLLASFFLFILISNWFGLVPGVGSITYKKHEAIHKPVNGDDHHEAPIPVLRATTADLNTTIALALISVVLIQFYGIKYVGLKGYLSKFITLKNPIAFFTGVLEIVSEISKIISFAFRLFGNIFAGEVLIAVVAFLIPILASFPFLLLEVFVGVIQALVFSLLTGIFLSIATVKHH